MSSGVRTNLFFEFYCMPSNDLPYITVQWLSPYQDQFVIWSNDNSEKLIIHCNIVGGMDKDKDNNLEKLIVHCGVVGGMDNDKESNSKKLIVHCSVVG